VSRPAARGPYYGSAAAPVRVASGRVVAAVTVSTATARVTCRQLRDELVPPLLRTAEAVSARLGFRGRATAAAGPTSR
jgi:IclR family pca regulon transcriptional regulator